jgi:hypothetical protein
MIGVISGQWMRQFAVSTSSLQSHSRMRKAGLQVCCDTSSAAHADSSVALCFVFCSVSSSPPPSSDGFQAHSAALLAYGGQDGIDIFAAVDCCRSETATRIDGVHAVYGMESHMRIHRPRNCDESTSAPRILRRSLRLLFPPRATKAILSHTTSPRADPHPVISTHS